MSHSLHEDLNDPHLFDEDRRGEYEYEQSELGKSASGYLELADDPSRDNKAQAEAGGDERRGRGHEWGADDGGHLIGARFGGATGEENLTAQARNLNRSGYKRLENEWASRMDPQGAGDKVFVHVETLGGDRPTAYMGYAIYEHPDGTRDYETFSFNNEGKDQVAAWEGDLAQWEAEHPEEAAELYGSDFLGEVGLDSEEALTPEEQEYGIGEDEGEVWVTSFDYDAEDYLGEAADEGQGAETPAEQEATISEDADNSMEE